MLACSTGTSIAGRPVALPPRPRTTAPPAPSPSSSPAPRERVLLPFALRLLAWTDHGAGPANRAVAGRPYRTQQQCREEDAALRGGAPWLLRRVPALGCGGPA